MKVTHEYIPATIVAKSTPQERQALAEVLGNLGYTSKTSQTEVDQWYNAASEGGREHMANKLIKRGYPTRGIHKADRIYQRGYKQGMVEGKAQARSKAQTDPVGALSLNQIVRGLKKHNVNLAEVVKEWYL